MPNIIFFYGHTAGGPLAHDFEKNIVDAAEGPGTFFA